MMQSHPFKLIICSFFASELANTVDLSARDNWEQFPLGELVSLLNIPEHKNGQTITATEGQETVQNQTMTTAEGHTVEKDVGDDKL